MCSFKIIQYLLILIALADSKITDDDYRLMPTLFEVDDFDVCMTFREKALYCNVLVQLSPHDSQNTSKPWKIIQETIRDPRYYRHDKLRHAICAITRCPNIDTPTNNEEALKQNLSTCYTSKLENLGLKAVATGLHCETDRQFYPIDNYDIAVGISLGIVILIVVLASLYEGRARYKTQEEYEKIINTKAGRVIACFSLPRNWARLRSQTNDPETSGLKCIQGVRFFTLLLVVMVHSALCTVAASIQNPQFTENLTRYPENLPLINGLGIIQTFLMVSGFLISYNFFAIIEKGKKKFQVHYIFLAFINRYIRLTPSLIVMVALHSSWLYHLGRGPMWDKSLGAEYRNCRQNWWANLLYINNYYDAENMCMQHAWYLATDTQLFLVALIVVALMWKFQNHIKIILGSAIIIGFALPSIINYYNDYDILIRMYPEALYTIFLNVPHWHAMYSSALVNFGAYALGLTVGYIFYKRKHKKLLTKRIYVALWWVISWSLPLSAIGYAGYIYQEDYHFTKLGAATYVALYRIFFAVGCGSIMYGCVEGAGWFIRDCLAWSPLQVLGRVAYCTYLVHVSVVRIRGGQLRSASYISYYTLFIQTTCDATVSFMFGTLLTLFVELPVSALQKLTLPKLGNTSNEERIENGEKDIPKEYNQRF